MQDNHLKILRKSLKYALFFVSPLNTSYQDVKLPLSDVQSDNFLESMAHLNVPKYKQVTKSLSSLINHLNY